MKIPVMKFFLYCLIEIIERKKKDAHSGCCWLEFRCNWTDTFHVVTVETVVVIERVLLTSGVTPNP